MLLCAQFGGQLTGRRISFEVAWVRISRFQGKYQWQAFLQPFQVRVLPLHPWVLLRIGTNRLQRSGAVACIWFSTATWTPLGASNPTSLASPSGYPPSASAASWRVNPTPSGVCVTAKAPAPRGCTKGCWSSTMPLITCRTEWRTITSSSPKASKAMSPKLKWARSQAPLKPKLEMH